VVGLGVEQGDATLTGLTSGELGAGTELKRIGPRANLRDYDQNLI
jgi:hypothetical protein